MTRPRAGDSVTVAIEAIAPTGAGTASISWGRVEIDGVGVGDTVTAQVTAVRRHVPEAFARVTAVVQSAGDVRVAPCHHAAPTRGPCGGCAIMHLSPAAQARAKEGWVRAALAPLGPNAIAFWPADSELGYRNRTTYLVFRTAGGVRLGARGPRSGVPARMDGCRVVVPALARVAEDVTRIVNGVGAAVFPEPGGLRYVSVRTGTSGDEALVELVTGEEPGRWLAATVDALAVEGRVTGVVGSVNTSDGNAIRAGGPPATLWGTPTVRVELAGVSSRIGPRGFAQLNFGVADRMIRRLSDHVMDLECGAEPVIWDLYCGAGWLGRAARAKLGRGRLYGADANAEAAEAARAEAGHDDDVRLDVVNLSCFSGAPHPFDVPTLIIMNPPRRGLDAAVLDAATRADAPVLMMSCDLETFARDATALIASGRRLECVDAFDMLPQTTHVELLARFTGRRPPAAHS